MPERQPGRGTAKPENIKKPSDEIIEGSFSVVNPSEEPASPKPPAEKPKKSRSTSSGSLTAATNQVLKKINKQASTPEAAYEREQFDEEQYRLRRETRTNARYALEAEAEEAAIQGRKEKLPEAIERLKSAGATRKELAKTQDTISDLRKRANLSMVRGERAKLLAEADALEAQIKIPEEKPQVAAVKETDGDKTPGAPEELITPTEGTPITPETVAENKEALKKAVFQFDAWAASSGVKNERDAMQAAEATYLKAYKEFHKGKGIDRLKGEPTSLHLLKKDYDHTRLKYAEALEGSKNHSSTRSLPFEARMQKRYYEEEEKGELAKNADGTATSFEEYMNKAYSDRKEKVGNYMRFREAVRPFAQKKIEARKEALNEKGKNVFEKSLGWLAKQNHKLEELEFRGKKLGKNGARAVRILVFTAGAGVIGAASGTFATASLLGVAGWGTWRVGRSLVGAIAGTAAGVQAGKLYEHYIGRKAQQEAKQNLKGLGKDVTLSPERLEELDKRREKLTSRADEETLAKKKAWVQMATALGVGAGSGAFLEYGSHAFETLSTQLNPEHVNSLVDSGGSHHVTPEQLKETLSRNPHHATPIEMKQLIAENPHHVTAEQMHEFANGHVSADAEMRHVEALNAQEAQRAMAATPGASQPFTQISVEAVHGDGAERMLHHLQEQLRAHNDNSPLAHYLLSDKASPDKLAQAFRFIEYSKHGLPQNAVIHPGDSFKIDDHDQLVFHNHLTNKDLVLMKVDASGQPQPTGNFYTGRLQPIHHVAPEAHHVAPHVTEAAAVSATQATNIDGLPPGMNPDSAAAADYLTAHHNSVIETSTVEHATVVPDSAPIVERPDVAGPNHAEVVPQAQTAATAEAVQQATSAPVGFDNAPPSINAIVHSDAWPNVNDGNSYTILAIPAESGNTSAEIFREQMFTVMRESGVGPLQNQSVEDYLAMAAKAIHEHSAQGADSFDTHPGIYETPDHHLQVHGGDLSARTLLANEYHLAHPTVDITIENSGAGAPLLKFPPDAEGHYTPADGTPATITAGSRQVF